MPLTIYLRQIREERDVFVYSQLEFDGFLWPVPTPGLEFVVWDADSFIFCSESRALLWILSRRLGNAREEGAVIGAPKLRKLYLPNTPTERVLKALRFYRNPVEFVPIKDSA